MTEYGHGTRDTEAPWAVRRPVVLSRPGDVHEQQARQAAARATTLPRPASTGTAAEPPQPSGTAMRDTVAQALTTPGQALDPTTRTDMQTRLGHDFGTVRIHTGTHADTSARQLHAAAYTTGHDVVFAAGRYRPTTPSGRTLLTHELTHVLQHDHDHHPPTPHNTPLHIHRQAATRPAGPSDLTACCDVLNGLYAMLDNRRLMALCMYKTVAVGMLVDTADPGFSTLGWTANGNWNDPAIAAALGALGAVRLNPGRSRAPRGAVGAPGDAEQRMIEDAESTGFELKAMAVSRPVCADCQEAIAEYGRDNGQVLVRVVPPPCHREVERALEALSDAAQRLRRQLELYSGEHRVEWDLVNRPSFSGFAGYWTNRLFNTDVPPLEIWLNAFASLAAAESSIRAGDVARALSGLIMARRRFLLALKRYSLWKEGLDGARNMAYAAIGAVAFASILAVVAPAAIAGLLEPAGSLANTELAAVRIAEIIAQADRTMVASETLVAETELAEEAEVAGRLTFGGR